ncbi:hypothetical protein PtA15_12A39 [Puccinia triticina]|uniref:Phosphoribosylanthranilate isomerase n=1 Tax=Puccinia triticina TaxID=208348 RepID=A0ABY7CZL9_9BASI|nr:uncharacterized protein PtA15_12A39 [Puccinia triticina]WAQ90054.1 hypothetical protein PtA15_12A39 [Puccinia triticina]
MHAFSILDSANLSLCGGTGQTFNWDSVKTHLASSTTTHHNLVIAGVEICNSQVAKNKDFKKISQVIDLIKSHS